MTASQPPVVVHIVGVHYQRPPSVVLLLCLVLTNPGPDHRWYLVPDDLAASGVVGTGTVNGAEVRLLAGSGRVVLVHFQGRRGFYGLLLPGRARVRLQGLPVDAEADCLDSPMRLKIVTAAAVNVGGSSARAWCGLNPACDLAADVAARGGALLAERWPDDLAELAVELTDAARIEVALLLNRD